MNCTFATKKVYHLIRKFLFVLTPEAAHRFTLGALHLALRVPVLNQIFIHRYNGDNGVRFCGLHFPNKVGLAAGFDKNAAHIRDLSFLGFGHIEVGTVTPLGQPGNSKPRLFRLPKDKALINRMGFNNDGVEVMVKNLTEYRLQRRLSDPEPIIGGNIGKNKATPNEVAVKDYEICYDRLYALVDYFVINVSSPNTPGLRELQDKEPLLRIINALSALRKKKEAEFPALSRRPLLLKIAPDLSDEQLNDVIDIALTSELDGLIATNTTIERQNLKSDAGLLEKIGVGGLSGDPLRSRAFEVLAYIHDRSNGSIPVIGVGGISSVEDGMRRLEGGAGLLQLYTGFIYGGPGLVKRLAKI